MILPAAMALLVVDRDADQKVRALAVWSAVGGAGVVTGAVLGGVVTDVLGWQWLFFGNVAIVALVLAGPPLLPNPGRDRSNPHLDLAGTLLLSTGVAGLPAVRARGGRARQRRVPCPHRRAARLRA